MPGRRFRIFSREFKEAAIRRILAREKILAVADELRLRSQLLYMWLDLYGQAEPTRQRRADDRVRRSRGPGGGPSCSSRAVKHAPTATRELPDAGRL